METVFLACAIVGGTLMVTQFVLSLFGSADHHDVDGHEFHVGGSHDGHDGSVDDTESSWFAGVLSFRAIVAALTIFGLAGMAGRSAWRDEPVLSLVVASAAGIATLFLVAGLMRALFNLRSEGTVHIERAIGKTGTVYLTIPGKRTGAGKVTLTLQNRTVEYQAVTNDQELPTGTAVMVIGVVNSDTIEVVPVPVTERTTHV